MYIPEGFGHAFLTLSKEAHIVYAVDKPYSPKDEITLRYDDNLLNINWKEIHKKYIPNVKIKTSKKDSNPLEFKNF
jgi:dTDP-4-dehydrorhamnose 3,5-epimerase